MRPQEIENRQSKIQHAFTLIELLVVVAIIAILASLLLPALTTARDKARVSACQTNHKQMYLATVMYLDDQEFLPPTVTMNSVSAHWLYRDYSNDRNKWYQGGLLWYMGYLNDPRTLLCTQYDSPAADNDYTNIYFKNVWVFKAKAASPGTGFTGSYAFNTIPLYEGPGKGRTLEPGVAGGYWDGGWCQVSGVTSFIQCDIHGITSQGSAHRRNGLNSTYVDGHVKWIPISYGSYWSKVTGTRQTYANRDHRAGGGLWPYATWVD